MADTHGTNGTRSAKLIAASPERLYQAFTDPNALVRWLVPGDMTGTIHQFDHRVGGGYEMSLFYPASEPSMRGKSGEQEDRYRARFVELTPTRIVEAITFDTDDSAFGGEMTMEITLEPKGDETLVTIVYSNMPSGIRLEDNEKGTKESLEKLARYVA